jgi:DHA1 family bicyclomycin/chloramphenicol resistance-like MFS transporter
VSTAGDDRALETARPRELTLALVLGSLTAVGPLSIDMYLPSLPAIQRDLGSSASAVQLTLASFFAGFGLAQFAVGPLSDRYGRKAPLYASIAMYVLASLGCAASQSVEMLVATRFLQAVASAAGPVTARAVVRDLYRGSEAARLMSLLILVMGAAPILAPSVGGAILALGGWRWVFVLLAALGLACIALVAARMPETLPAARRSARIAVRAVASDLVSLARDRDFVAYTLCSGFASAGMFAYISASPFVFIEIFRLTPRTFGWIFGANAFGYILFSQVNRRLLLRASAAAILKRAIFATVAAGAVLLVVGLRVERPPLVLTMLGLFGFVASLGLVAPNATVLAMEAHGERAGVASATLGSVSFGVAAISSGAVSALEDGTLRPMTFTMAGCAAVALGFAMISRPTSSRRAGEAPSPRA